MVRGLRWEVGVNGLSWVIKVYGSGVFINAG